MGFSKLVGCCEKCPYLNTCNHKIMEAVGYLQPTSNQLLAPIAENIARETRTIRVNGHQETIYVDEIKKELYKQLCSGLLMHFGA